MPVGGELERPITVLPIAVHRLSIQRQRQDLGGLGPELPFEGESLVTKDHPVGGWKDLVIG